MKKLFGFSLLLLALALTVGCGGGSKDDNVSISLTPNEVTVETGELVVLSAKAKNTEITLPPPGSLDGTYFQVGRYGVSYTAPARPGTVDFTISAAVDGQTATSKINVIWARPTLTFTPARLSAQPGKNLQFTVDARYFAGSPKTDIGFDITATRKVFDYEDCKENRNCQDNLVDIGVISVAGIEYNIETTNAEGVVTDVIDVRYNVILTPYADLELGEDGLSGTVSATGVYGDNNLPVSANAALTVTQGGFVVFGHGIPLPAELTGLSTLGSTGLWYDKPEEGTYDNYIDGLGIPDRAYVFNAFTAGFQPIPIASIAGYTRVSPAPAKASDLKAGEWALFENTAWAAYGMYFNYLVIVPKDF